MSEYEENELEVPPSEMAAQATAIMPVLRSNVPLLHRLKGTGNVWVQWRQWKQVWDSYELVSGLKSQSGE